MIELESAWQEEAIRALSASNSCEDVVHRVILLRVLRVDEADAQVSGDMSFVLGLEMLAVSGVDHLRS